MADYTAFVVDKGQAATQDNDGDDRYRRYLVAYALPQQAMAWRFIPLRLRIFRVVSIR